MLRKITALLLLSALLFNSLGYLGLFLVAHHYARARMWPEVHRERSSEEAAHLVEIVVPGGSQRAGEVHVYGEELRYHGVMYDIVRVERGAHETRYYALRDEYDTAYFRELSQFMKARRADAGERPGRILPFLKKVYATALFILTLKAPTQQPLLLQIERVLVPTAPFLAVFVPPPWSG